MDKPKKEKQHKPRPEKYDTKLAINGGFEDVIKASFLGKPPVNKQAK